MRFSRLFGDSQTFGIQLALASAPRDSAHSEREASWGTFALWVRGRCVTRSEQHGAMRDDVEWYLAPLLTWLDESAVPLLNEEPVPALVADEVSDASHWLATSLAGPPYTSTDADDDRWRDERFAYWRRHALAAVGDGGAWPNVILRRVGDQVEISWDNDRVRAPRRDLRFVEPRGAECVAATHVAAVLGEAVRTTAAAIDVRATFKLHGALANGAGPGAGAWTWLVTAPARRALEEKALRQVHRSLDRSVPASGALVPHTPLSSWLRAIPESSPDVIREIATAATSAPAQTMTDRLSALIRPSLPVGNTPWELGYQRALEVRAALGWSDRRAPPLRRWLRACQVDVGNVRATDWACAVRMFHGRRARIITTNSSNLSAEMKLATGLGHLLLDLRTEGDDGVASSAWTHWPSAARAKAFGAMLLMPEPALRSLAVRESDPVALTRSVMASFDVSAELATWHIRNVRIFSEETRLRVLRRLWGAAHQN